MWFDYGHLVLLTSCRCMHFVPCIDFVLYSLLLLHFAIFQCCVYIFICSEIFITTYLLTQCIKNRTIGCSTNRCFLFVPGAILKDLMLCLGMCCVLCSQVLCSAYDISWQPGTALISLPHAVLQCTVTAIFCLPGPQQQTHSIDMRWANGLDRRTPNSFIDSAPQTMRGVS